MKYLKCIATIVLLLITSLPALETVIQTDEKNPAVAVYSVKQPEKYRQVSFKAEIINLLMTGESKDKLEVVFFAQERKNKTSNRADSYFSDYRKGKAVLKESNESAVKNLVESAVSEKEQEVIFDVHGDYKKYDLYAMILLPAGYAAQISVKAGNVSVESMASELSLTNIAGNISVENSRGVATISGKAGNIEIKNFQGVINAGLLSGNVDISKSEGDLTVKMSTGNCEVSSFTGRASFTNKVGNLELNNLRKTDFSIKNISGNVEIKGLDDCGQVKISNETGEIAMENSKMKKLSIQASGGDIDLKNVDAVYNIKSTAGDVTISTNSLLLNDDNLIELDYGDIELNLRDKANYLFFKNPSGDKMFNAEQDIEADSYLRIKRKTGQGKQFMISVDTGSITVK